MFLMKWYCRKKLDQWENWKVNTKYGPVYVSFVRENINRVERFDIEI